MENPLLFKIALITLLLLISGFFSGSESAFFSLSFIQREKIKNQKSRRSVLVKELLSHPRLLIITILMGNDLVNIAASVVATYLFVAEFGDAGKWIAIATMTPLTLIFAEVIPKTISMQKNERIALFAAKPIFLFSNLIKPARWFLDLAAEWIMKLIGVKKKAASPSIKEADFLDMVDISHESGEITETAKELIHNVFEFGDVLIHQVMTPFENIFSLPDEMSGDALIAAVKQNRFSRIPIYKTDKTNITGLLYVKDILKTPWPNDPQKKIPLNAMKRAPYFIQDSAKVEDLFEVMQKKRLHMAFCLDRSGRASGLVTMEDLLEELFGEIYDEYDGDQSKPGQYDPPECQPIECHEKNRSDAPCRKA